MAPNTDTVRGIRIGRLNILMVLVSLLLFLGLIYTTLEVEKAYQATVRATANFLSWEKNGANIRAGSDYLTDQVRLYTQRLDRHFADNYFQELHSRRRELAVETLPVGEISRRTRTFLRSALDRSNELAEREIYAITLAAMATGQDLSKFPPEVRAMNINPRDRALGAEAKIALARQMVFNEAYLDAKGEIMGNVYHFLNDIIEETSERQREDEEWLGKVLARERAVLFGLFALNLLAVILVVFLVVRPLRAYMAAIRQERMLDPAGAYELRLLAREYNDFYALKIHNDRMLRYKAEHDPLTGLANQRTYEALRESLRKQPIPVGLLLVDVDRFKDINDVHGHKIGDEVLRRVGELLEHSFRAGDLCVRFGGDEFAVVLKDVGAGMKETIRRKIGLLNERLQHPEDDLPPVSVSAGGAFSGAGFSETLYGEADKALYHVKDQGRCGCSFYDETLSPAPDRA